MPDPQRTRRERRPSGAVAGYLLLAVVLAFAAVGVGVGALLDAVAPFLVVAVLLGFIAGLALVYSRYRTL